MTCSCVCSLARYFVTFAKEAEMSLALENYQKQPSTENTICVTRYTHAHKNIGMLLVAVTVVAIVKQNARFNFASIRVL